MLQSFWTQTFAAPPFVAAAPVNIVAPNVTGSPTVGSTLTSDNGTWSGAPTITYSYQWNNGSDIPGATSSTYTVQSGDNGLNLICKVTATNTAGSAEADSNALGPLGSSPSDPIPILF